MSNNKQSSVDWLINVVQSCIAPDYIPQEIIQQAKEMEKERLKDAFIEGANTIYAIPKTFDEWYNETYGGNK